MENIQPVQDPFGLGRLAQAIRANRQEKAAMQLQGLQEKVMRGQIAGQELQLAEAMRQNQLRTGLIDVIKSNPDKDADYVSLQYLSANDPQGARQLQSEIISQANVLSKTSPRAAVDLINSKLGKNYGYLDFTGGKGKKAFQKTGAFLVRDKETGNQSIATGVLDPNTGTLSTETADLSKYDVISKLGETAEETSERKVTEQRMTSRAKKEEERSSDLIERGIAAAESTAVLRRGIELLKDIETGGVAAVKLRAKQILGVESEKEGELSNLMAKAVLSQLRSTFGAAFTENEGNRLFRIEAGFGKSPAANRQLLKQALRIAERTAKRARIAAEKTGDKYAMEDIDELMSFSLDGEKTDQGETTQVLNFDAQGNLIK